MTRSRALTTLVVTAAVTSIAVGCGGEPTGPRTSAVSDAQISADLAAASGDAIAAAVAEFAAAEGLVGLGGLGAVGCPYDAATQYHVCSLVTERGLAVTRKYQFREASGTPTESYDPGTTASVNFLFTVDGTHVATTDAGRSWTRTTHGSSDRTVSGLAGTETQLVWNGTGTSADTSTHSGPNVTRNYASTVTRVERDVVVTLPRPSSPWPQSGTVTYTTNATLTVSGSRDAARTVTRTAVVTFNGTVTVPITVNGVNCTLNLDTHRVSGCGG